MTEYGKATRTGYAPSVSLREYHAERARLAELEMDVQVLEVKLTTGFLYFGLCGQPESPKARESRTRDHTAYARHVAVWFALVDRWAGMCEELYTAGYPHACDPPDLPYLLEKYIGD